MLVLIHCVHSCPRRWWRRHPVDFEYRGIGHGDVEGAGVVQCDDWRVRVCAWYFSSKVLMVYARTWAIASVMAPLVSGALAEEGQWRWLFCAFARPPRRGPRRGPRCSLRSTDLNIPIAGAAAILVVLFMKMKKPEGTLKQKLAKMDWMWVTHPYTTFLKLTFLYSGNTLCIGSTTAITLGLTWGGVTFAWNSARVISLLVIGFCGLCAFLAYEAWYATYPMVG